jgi:hypothetical protein
MVERRAITVCFTPASECKPGLGFWPIAKVADDRQAGWTGWKRKGCCCVLEDETIGDIQK